MSKSLKRVERALQEAGEAIEIIELNDCRTAAQAAASVGCELDQIAKSIIFRGENSQQAVLFITAGGNQVDPAKASTLTGEPLGKADATLIRAQTGFAIGGVAPIGHLSPIRAFVDPRLLEFTDIWAAAGTPRHVFRVKSEKITALTGAQLSDFIK